jgi:ergothioneine biosynthesis protein EgtB
MTPIQKRTSKASAEGAGPAADLLRRYRRIRSTTQQLCEGLTPEDMVVQSMPDASPAKWHLAHSTWFFETMVLSRARPERPPFHPLFPVLFNSYYLSLGERHPRPRRGLLTRPTADEVRSYRARIDDEVEQLLAAGEGPERAVLDLIDIGLHHEEQHQELLLTDLKHLFAQNPLRPVYAERPPDTPAEAPPPGWAAFPGGMHQIGHDGEGFAFDNEGPRHAVHLEPFRIATRPVTNGEVLSFLEDGGYRRGELWLSDGWNAVLEGRWEAPLYWERGERGWLAMTLAGLRPIVSAEPACHLSYYEADAIARWAGARLPREEEWEVASIAGGMEGTFLEDRRFHPGPVPAGRPGLLQVLGDVWEWTGSAYLPYPGYRPPPGPLGEYNGKFMCGQMVLRGGSCVTPRAHIRRTYRNFFSPGARWQFSGVRLAMDG